MLKPSPIKHKDESNETTCLRGNAYPHLSTWSPVKIYQPRKGQLKISRGFCKDFAVNVRPCSCSTVLKSDKADIKHWL
ncbi:hypothetical protein SUGI_0487310 [Cryptomeria japonica]|nr:hypothetical protein SUGI_0487310 [Cryptomeria japonica]